MSLHELIQFLDSDTFWMLTHQAENQFDGTILLGKFSTVRHDCSFWPPFFSRYLRRGTRGLKLFPGYVLVANRRAGRTDPSDFEQLTTKQ